MIKKEVGLWIDHRKAVIVFAVEPEDTMTLHEIESGMEKHIRYSGASHASGDNDHNDTTEDGRDRRFGNELNRYYDDVIAVLVDATDVLIIGPGEAKIELQTRIDTDGHRGQHVTVKTADKLTDEQIMAEVRQHFGLFPHGSNSHQTPEKDS